LADAHLILAKFYVTQNSMKRAAEELERAVALEPGHAEAWSLLVIAREGLGDLEAARRAARKTIALRPNDVDDRVRLAVLLGRTGDSGAARRAFEEALVLDRRSVAAHREYAYWLLKAGSGPDDWRRAESSAREAVSLDPGDAAARIALGRALALSGRREEAIAPLRAAAEMAPTNPAAALALARTLRALGRTAEARVWDRAYATRQRRADAKRAALDRVQRNPDDPEPHRRLARLFAAEGDVAGCVRHHARALRTAPDAPAASIAAANDLVAAGHAAEALPLARRAVAVGAASPAAHEALGNALLGAGRPREAAASFDKAAGWWPHRFDAYRDRLERFHRRRAVTVAAAAAAVARPAEQAYRESRRLLGGQVGPIQITPEMETLAARAVSLEPADLRYLRHLMTIQVQQRNRAAAAIATGERILALAPDDAKTHALLAVLLAENAAATSTDFARIESHLERAAADPAAAATRSYGQGLLALRREQGSAAVAALKRAAELDPQPDVTYYKLALAQKMAGDAAAADRTMALFRNRRERRQQEADALRSLAQQPDRPQAYARAAALFDAHGRSADAEAIRSAAARRFPRQTTRGGGNAAAGQPRKESR
jgi:tetratricopeptide (TPR) repeat protein